MKEEILIESPEERKLLAELKKRNDPEALRLRRFLSLPDLSRTTGNPIAELARRIAALPDFQIFDVLRIPEIVPMRESFDLFNFPPDHPVRSRSDTYYVTDEYILRPHTTIMWYYHLLRPEIKEKVARGEPVGVLSYGKVYRKDEIDRRHMNVFHQMDGLYICKRKEQAIGPEDLQDVLIKIAQTIFGADIQYRFNKDTFPYTDPSLEMEIEVNGKWIEVLGSGVVRGEVLDNLGVDSQIYNGWAFGFGLERLAILSMDLPDIRLLWSEDERVKRQLTLGTPYKEVSKYPPVTRDISFVVNAEFTPNDYFDLIRDVGGNLVEEVSLLDKYENVEKFGAGRVSYTYRTTYRSTERTLTNEEVQVIHERITEETKKQFGAEVR